MTEVSHPLYGEMGPDPSHGLNPTESEGLMLVVARLGTRIKILESALAEQEQYILARNRAYDELAKEYERLRTEIEAERYARLSDDDRDLGVD